MREWLEKKWVQVLLLTFVLSIWGYNTYSIVGLTAGEEATLQPDAGTEIDLKALHVPETERYIYNADFRDPFTPELRPKTPSRPAAPEKQPEREVPPPKLTLNGIVEAMALIQNQNQELFFVTAGDTVDGARVRVVEKDSVVLTYKSKPFILKFNK